MKKIISMFVLCLVLLTLVPALEVTLLTPKATLRTTENTSATYYVGVQNKNNYSINITYVLPERNISFEGNLSHALAPGETRYTNFSVFFVQAGNYSDVISVVFSSFEGAFSLQEQLLFIVSQNQTCSTPVWAINTATGECAYFQSTCVIPVNWPYQVITACPSSPETSGGSSGSSHPDAIKPLPVNTTKPSTPAAQMPQPEQKVYNEATVNITIPPHQEDPFDFSIVIKYVALGALLLIILLTIFIIYHKHTTKNKTNISEVSNL